MLSQNASIISKKIQSPGCRTAKEDERGQPYYRIDRRRSFLDPRKGFKNSGILPNNKS
jgi:hypothetical protein